MSQILAASIDLTKIDKTRIVQGKNGAQYYNLTIIVNDTKDQYGNDISVQQGQTKEERASKAKAVYIGNGKKIWEGESKQTTSNAPSVTEGLNDLPF
jgi:hypothetical protein